MAKAKEQVTRTVVKKKTSIGLSFLSRPTNKHKRRSWKKYKGQGR
jgi:hypothetical protein